jgi:DNA uptake protein ComE-like DNA-binding protein
VAPLRKNRAKAAEEWLVEGPESEGSDEAEDNARGSTADEAVAVEDHGPSAPARQQRAVGSETAQWVVPSTTDLNGGADDREEKSTGASRSSPARDSAAEAAEKRSKTRRRRASKASKKAQPGLDQLRTENVELAGRVRDLQTELRFQAKRAKAAEAELQQQIAELESALADAKKGGRAGPASTSARRRNVTTASTARKQPTGSRRQVKTSGDTSKAATSRRRRRAGGGNGKLDLNRASFEELRNLGLSVTQSARLIAYRDVRSGFESLDELDDIPGLPKDTRAGLRARLTLSA